MFRKKENTKEGRPEIAIHAPPFLKQIRKQTTLPIIDNGSAQMNEDQIKNTLAKYIPEKSLTIVCKWFLEDPIHLRITNTRNTKSGDYRPPEKGKGIHRISVNHDLNPYAFLLTLTHELAHMKAFIKYGPRIKPHGTEWQSSFIRLMRPLLAREVFPKELNPVLINHLEKGRASTYTDLNLRKALIAYDKQKSEPDKVFLQDLPEGSRFAIKDGRTFIKGKQLRKNFHCISLNNKKEYRVHPLAEVKRIESSEN